ncbi:hypothetical protein OPQ81_002624 [Rhizoctonia solani]|nr:hypothetical protein OPQ81_002624 [Rhizoctonia solani]
MPRLPFGHIIPTAPGSSHYVSNALIIAARVALGLADPVRIQFSASGKASESLSDWCRLHSHTSVESMQLRKEKKAPFFHEYIAFRLRDRAGCFRIDRRQLPNEGSPLDCTEEAGVEAYETIEEILNLEHSIYNPSDCLVEVEFTEDVRLNLIIDICREISQHEMANVYTVQRYNCYFYAQTILLFTLCKGYGWYESYIWRSGDASSDDDVVKNCMPLAGLSKNSRITIRVLDKKLQPHLMLPSDVHCDTDFPPSPTECSSVWRSPIRMFRPQRKGSQSSIMKETDIGDLQAYLSDMIHAHSVRVEQYKMLLKCSAWEVEGDIKQTMNEIWKKRWLLLGQVDSMILQLQAPRAQRYRRGQKDRQNSGKVGTGHESELKRRPRVATKKEWEREWEVVGSASVVTESHCQWTVSAPQLRRLTH